MTEAAIAAELMKMGLGWLVAGYFYLETRRLSKDFRAAQDAAFERLLSEKDKHTSREIDANNRQADIAATNAKALGALAEKIDGMGGQMLALNSEVKNRPCYERKGTA